ncbi:MAG: PDZ domain-containing protein, partial [Terriglobia bacterium]
LYTFVFHFPAVGGGGGMEHSYGTAISFPAGQLDNGFEDLENTIAHEFFHLWNVKRIRPQGLEPVDYVHGNDTSGLWFCEGVTSTYAELTLLRAGLISAAEFFSHLAAAISELERRPARHFQSVALSGREAWLEKYPDYRRPERSISYYNNGELLGYILDLAIRQASGNRNSLDDLMRLLDTQFARQHRYYTDADLERLIASLGPGDDWARSFFQDDVTGTADLDYQHYLGAAGLRLVKTETLQPAWGIETVRNPGGLIQVTSVEPGSGAAQAGLESGDVLLEINGQPLYAAPGEVLGLKPGERLKLRVRRGTRVLTVRLTLGARREVRYRVEEAPNATAEQLAIRAGWLYGRRPAGGGAAP